MGSGQRIYLDQREFTPQIRRNLSLKQESHLRKWGLSCIEVSPIRFLKRTICVQNCRSKPVKSGFGSIFSRNFSRLMWPDPTVTDPAVTSGFIRNPGKIRTG